MLMVQKAINENSNVEQISYVEFDANDIEEYRQEFERFKKIGVINADCEFESDSWTVKTGITYSSVKFKMTEIEYQKVRKGGVIQLGYEEFGCALRCYAVIELRRLISMSVGMMVNDIEVFLKVSKGFSTSFIPKVMNDEDFNNKAINIERLLKFLDFIGVELDIRYIDQLEVVLDKYKVNMSARLKNRKLPLFSDAFKADDYMQQAIEYLSDDEFEKFFPIVLWWKLSTIIPMRSTEIIATVKDCLCGEQEENKMIVSRSVLKGKTRTSFKHTFEECYRLQKIKVSSEVISLIQRYNSIVDEFDGDRRFLISKKSIMKYIPNMKSARVLERELFRYSHFRLNVDTFYQEILYGKYGLNVVGKKEDELNDGEIQRFNIMDTRHFAIINMVLMGFEPYTIKEIAGHEAIQSSYHYFSHVEEFVQCYVISMAKRKALKKEVAEKNLVLDATYSNLQREQINKHVQKLKLYTKKYKTVDDGLCMYEKDDFLPCYAVDGNHKRCKYFYPDKKNAGNLIAELDKIDKEIATQTEALRLLVEKHMKTVDFSNKYNHIINSLRNKANNKAELYSNYIASSFSEDEKKLT